MRRSEPKGEQALAAAVASHAEIERVLAAQRLELQTVEENARNLERLAAAGRVALAVGRELRPSSRPSMPARSSCSSSPRSMPTTATCSRRCGSMRSRPRRSRARFCRYNPRPRRPPTRRRPEQLTCVRPVMPGGRRDANGRETATRLPEPGAPVEARSAPRLRSGCGPGLRSAAHSRRARFPYFQWPLTSSSRHRTHGIPAFVEDLGCQRMCNLARGDGSAPGSNRSA